MSIEYAIIVKNKTRLESLVERFNTKAHAKFYIERSGGYFKDYEIEHENFHTSLESVQREVTRIIKNKLVERSFLPSFLFSGKHMVIVVGQDGLVANTAKYVNGLPIIAINPDPERHDGILLPYTPANFTPAAERVLDQQYNSTLVTMAEAQLNDGQRLLAFNDFFIGASSHVSARYRITFSQRTEEHSSSGIIVSTGAGSTGWLSSIFNMTNAINESMLTVKSRLSRKLQWDENQLMFVVREPFASKKTRTDVAAGFIKPGDSLIIESLMPSNGVIFSDGIESDYMRFNSGSIATIGIAKEKARLVTEDIKADS